MQQKLVRIATLGLAVAAPLWLAGCAQVTVTADTIVDGTARVADATTNAVEGTSNFTTHVTRDADARTHQARLAFVDSQLRVLRRETANGEGEHLRALAYMMHAQDQAGFARMMQVNYTRLFAADANAEQVLARLYQVAGTPPDMRRG